MKHAWDRENCPAKTAGRVAVSEARRSNRADGVRISDVEAPRTTQSETSKDHCPLPAGRAITAADAARAGGIIAEPVSMTGLSAILSRTDGTTRATSIEPALKAASSSATSLSERFKSPLTTTTVSCTACADACLAEDAVADLRNCIRTNLDCADVCVATASVLSRRTGSNLTVVTELLKACRTACATCAEDCEAHADMHEHCKLCADACRRCEKACSDLLSAIG